MEGGALIRVENVSQTFKIGEEHIPVLRDSSFTIKIGTFNIVYGLSGSGKSTLLNVISGLQEPSSGTVTYAGQDIYQLSNKQLAYFRAKQIGVVYQQNNWVSSLNVLENVAMPLLFLGYHRKAAVKPAMDALQRVDMATFAKKDPRLLSGGEQQRIAVARAIVADPAFIITDEPTGNLDSKNGDMVMALLQSYNADLKRTIILVTHNMEYLPLADQLVHIQDGHCEPMINDDIKQATQTLFEDMRARIKRYEKAKKNARK